MTHTKITSRKHYVQFKCMYRAKYTAHPLTSFKFEFKRNTSER